MYKRVVLPVLNHLDSEKMHNLVRFGLECAQRNTVSRSILATMGKHSVTHDPRLHVTVSGLDFVNPLLVGAGWTKNGDAALALCELGFAGVEVGTVTPFPEEGNKKPRQWARDGVVLNYAGLPNLGAVAIAKKMSSVHCLASDYPIGMSIGNDATTPLGIFTYLGAAELVKCLNHVADYFTLNISCPNLEIFSVNQDTVFVKDSVQAIMQTVRSLGKEKPVFIKVSPDMTYVQLNELIQIAIDSGVGLIIANTTSDMGIKSRYGWRGYMGGLSGDDDAYRMKVNRLILHTYRETKGTVSIIGCGGVHDAQTTLAKIRLGASLVQIVSGIRGEGPLIAVKIAQGLIDYLDKEGISSIQEIVGCDVF